MCKLSVKSCVRISENVSEMCRFLCNQSTDSKNLEKCVRNVSEMCRFLCNQSTDSKIWVNV
jgi:hypothetical protein